MHKISKFQILGLADIVPYCKTVGNYIMYDIPFKLHKTHKWSPTPFPMYTFKNSGSKQRGGKKNQHKCPFFCSECLYTLYKYILIHYYIYRPIGHVLCA